MKTNQALNTNPANNAHDETHPSFSEHYLQIIKEKAKFLNKKEDEDYFRFRKMIDQILFIQ